jgi:acetolactate synthase I/II/III large subunit
MSAAEYTQIPEPQMKAAELLVRCLENEGVQTIFGIPGEENIDIMDCLLDSPIRFITTRHEQGAAFMADVHGRLTGRAGVCLATLGPGATNLVTGVADANMDRAPVVAIAGQAATTQMHKESHQHLDLVNLFQPITKFRTQIIRPETIPEIVRKAFKQAEAEKPGVSFLDFPEDIAQMPVEGKKPLLVQRPLQSVPPPEKIKQAAEIISAAKYPLIMAGNGVVRARASTELVRFAQKLQIPVASTFMAKGVIPFSHCLWLGAVGLRAHDYVACGFDRADVIICVGYDMVEYPPNLWHPSNDRKIVHIDSMPAEVDEHYIPACGVLGNIAASLEGIAAAARPQAMYRAAGLWQAIMNEVCEYAEDDGFPVKPQKIVWELRRALPPRCNVVCDVGAHKMWMARLYQPECVNTCIISNGFAAMGIAVPGAIAAKLAFPDRPAVAVTGDAGFMMNSQEIETAIRVDAPIVVLIWNDNGYGLIEWHQLRHFGRASHVSFQNPDFVKYAESFGAKGYRVESAGDLGRILRQAIASRKVTIIDCPVDYRENMKLTEKLQHMVCPI